MARPRRRCDGLGMEVLRTNLADYPVTLALKQGSVSSELVSLEFCGPKTAHDGFKAMLREGAFDAGELAIVTYLQAKAYGKPWVMLPTPMECSIEESIKIKSAPFSKRV